MMDYAEEDFDLGFEGASISDFDVSTAMGGLRTRYEVALDRVATATELLKAAEAEVSYLEQNDAVELMRTLDLTEYEFGDGVKIKRKQRVHASITDLNKDEAHQWLLDNGHGNLLKVKAIVEFRRGEEVLARNLQKWFNSLFPAYEISVLYGETTPRAICDAVDSIIAELYPEHKLEIETGLHSSTLKSFVTKQLRAGKSLPSCFNVFAPQVAQLELPKATENEPSAQEGAF